MFKFKFIKTSKIEMKNADFLFFFALERRHCAQIKTYKIFNKYKNIYFFPKQNYLSYAFYILFFFKS